MLCWPLQPHLGPHPPTELSVSGLHLVLCTSGPLLMLFPLPQMPFPPLPLSFFPPQPCLLSSRLPLPWGFWYPHHSCPWRLSSLPLHWEPRRAGAWPRGQCLPHRRWSVGVYGGGQDSWQRGGEESWLRTCWLLLPKDSVLPRHRGPEGRVQWPASHPAPALATHRASVFSSVSWVQHGRSPTPVPWAPRGRVAGLRSALTRCQHEADCPALSPQVTTMSVRVRFLSSGDTGTMGVMGRSASFAGFSSAQSRRIA